MAEAWHRLYLHYMNRPLKIAIAGASGFIGKNLATRLEAQGHQIIRLVRQASDDLRKIPYDYQQHEIEANKLEGLDAVINLAGQNLTGGYWTKAYKKLIFDSRVQQTEFLAHLLANLHHPPKVVLGASAMGYYGDRGDELLTEHSTPGKGFLAETCRVWEDAYLPLSHAGVRVCQMRFGLILDKNSGQLPTLMLPFRFGLGAILGSGKQFISWMAIEDLLNGIQFLLDHDHLEGPFNFSSPNPIQQKVFSQTIAASLSRPLFLHLPQMLLNPLLGELADEVIFSGQRMMPDRLLRHGFSFVYQDIGRFFSK